MQEQKLNLTTNFMNLKIYKKKRMTCGRIPAKAGITGGLCHADRRKKN